MALAGECLLVVLALICAVKLLQLVRPRTRPRHGACDWRAPCTLVSSFSWTASICCCNATAVTLDPIELVCATLEVHPTFARILAACRPLVVGKARGRWLWHRRMLTLVSPPLAATLLQASQSRQQHSSASGAASSRVLPVHASIFAAQPGLNCLRASLDSLPKLNRLGKANRGRTMCISSAFTWGLPEAALVQGVDGRRARRIAKPQR